MTIAGIQCVDNGSETVVFWDGCEWTRDELESVRPGLFEFVQQHPRLVESPPYSFLMEVVYSVVFYVLVTIFIVGPIIVIDIGIGMPIGWQQIKLMFVLGSILFCIAGVMRIILGFFSAHPVMVARGGSIELYERRETPNWTTGLADIDWKIGRGFRCATRSSGCVFAGMGRRVILLKRPKRKFWLERDEFYGCGWTPEMQEWWLLLLEFVDRGQTPVNGTLALAMPKAVSVHSIGNAAYNELHNTLKPVATIFD